MLFVLNNTSYLGLEHNSYKKFIAYKVIDEDECTIGRFVDNNKVSDIDDNVNSMIADKIEKNWKLSITTENKHTVLAVDIKFIGVNKVAV